ncbi:MAG: heat-inducible transcription repressor HrcA [Candidatus Schekmanbacteria bacterium GWA2_38_9]|uniref:Heat-inducible transcription repressor HrcA n=1 Tax=Candidatus Schekmanbacteria bacterium RIFCSPLOWO2_12_FULL_38_15 TaxID=1817883 RepID=A0A1F7SN55_9BACT|nr:MAG: heat-inducible transcription repressor HrcA [Candidatus Schekmanbacteria bacterium GWA2_38_9]OGL55212.1 MAG: heat-inducible transcription repressor HrcA [Candidatus Schekmanbacteria bacterium RIFCSPLOWO2_12_FULL_38_15]
MEELSIRNKQILKAVITSYVSTAEPVGSRTITKKFKLDLSPATVRNIMSDLEEMGFLSHPYTSAGRVPTNKAYRFYVDSILSENVFNSQLPIQFQFGDELKESNEAVNVEDIMKRISHRLSQISNQVGIILAPKFSFTTFKHIEFINLREKRVLAIFVTKSGMIQNKLIKFDEDLSQDTLDKITRYLNEQFQGMTLCEIREKLREMMLEEKRLYDKLVARALTLSSLAFSNAEEEEIYFDGTANILNQPEFSDVEEMKRIFAAFEQKNLLLQLLDKCVNSKGMQIFIGTENPVKEIQDLSIVTSVYKSGDRVLGTLGIIGPTRMDYSQIIPLVSCTAVLMSNLFTDV